MRFNIPKKLDILGTCYKVKLDGKSGSGSFDTSKCEIIIGTKYLKSDPSYTFHVLLHEVSEIIHAFLGDRYDNTANNSWAFFMDHRDFENHNRILADIIYRNILIKEK